MSLHDRLGSARGLAHGEGEQVIRRHAAQECGRGPRGGPFRAVRKDKRDPHYSFRRGSSRQGWGTRREEGVAKLCHQRASWSRQCISYIHFPSLGCCTQGEGKGCAFLKFVERSSAIQAIEALNERQVVEGASRPMVVRFAESKRSGEGGQGVGVGGGRGRRGGSEGGRGSGPGGPMEGLLMAPMMMVPGPLGHSLHPPNLPLRGGSEGGAAGGGLGVAGLSPTGRVKGGGGGGEAPGGGSSPYSGAPYWMLGPHGQPQASAHFLSLSGDGTRRVVCDGD